MKNDNERIEELENQITSLEETEKTATMKLVESQEKWTNFAEDILAISKELFKAVITLRSNNPISNEFLQRSEARIKKYDAFLNDNKATFCNAKNTEPTSAQLQGQANSQVDIQPGTYAFLDSEKIKSYLKTSKDDIKICGLLQSLKRRLLQTCKRTSRKTTMDWFVNYDILECACNDGIILEKLLLKHSKKYFLSVL